MPGDGDVRIVEFTNALAPAFAALNYEWIAESYEIEAHDREILDDPLGSIITGGGQIFFALDGEMPVGTVALVEIDADRLNFVKWPWPQAFRAGGSERDCLLNVLNTP